MTALDDALNSSSVVIAAPKLIAQWVEAGPGEDLLSADARTNLSQQMTGEYSIEHSFDDGLPDPVTMTTGGDASGKLIAVLNGKEGMVLSSSGARSNIGTQAGVTTKTVVGAGPGADTAYGDYMICVIAVSDPLAVLLPTYANQPKLLWDQLAFQSDTGIGVWVFGSRYWGAGKLAPSFTSSTTVSFVSRTVSFWANNPIGYPIDFRVTQAVALAEAASVTAHTVTTKLTDKGYQIGVWATTAASAQWAPTGTDTEMVEAVASNLDFAITQSVLKNAGTYTLQANTTAATAVGVMIGLSLEPYQRPRMDARQYFSPFNRYSPVYGYDRDTADTVLTHNTVTATGIVGSVLHTGIMSDIPLKGRQAELASISKTRIDLNASVTLPVVFGYREGCTTDWLASWLLSRGGKFIGPAPTVYTRAWATMHGSVHSHISSPYTYNYATRYDALGGPWGYKSPVSVPGPFLTGMYAQQSATEIKEVIMNWIRPDLTADVLPYYQPDSAGNTTPVYNDIFSQAANKGRLTLWLRGDPVTTAPAYTGAGNDLIFQYWMRITALDGSTLGTILINVRSSDRQVAVRLGSTAAGDTNLSYPSLALPSDGLWHFYGFHWDFSLGKFDMIMDSTEIHTTSFSPTAATAQLPVTDTQGRALGHVINTQVRSHVPIAEYMWDVPPAYVAGQWDNWKTPMSPGATVTTRPTYQWLQTIAEPTPVTVWDTLSEVAQSTLSAYRANELDRMELLPPSYFGEAAQMAVSVVQDTQVNAADLDVTLDPSKTRNVVTVQFPETSVSTNRIAIKSVTEALAIPKGVTIQVFTLDLLTAEIHGQSTPFGANWMLTNLTSGMISTPTTIPAGTHFLSANTAADGGGTVLPFNKVSGTILYGDASTITIQFNNQSGAVAYLSNNGDGVPFLKLYGYAVTVNDGYVTQRDINSVASRKERGLTSELSWIQTRGVANDIAMLLVNMLARPRAQIAVQTVGDPRRKPGQMVQIKDAEGTQASGTWRILRLTHDVNGPQYTNNLLLMNVGPIGVWDDPTTPWDNSVWGV